MTYVLSIVLVMIGFSYLILTLVLSRTKKPIGTVGAPPSRYVFIVPALNEERVVLATVDSLLNACGPSGRVVVIDDGSSDQTAELVRSRMAGDGRVVLHQRVAPNAKLGKGKALNDVYRVVRDGILAEGVDPHDVVLGIVDADGRLEPDVLKHVSRYFVDKRVGATQLLVRIRNRDAWLARFQDYEFLIFSSLTQTAREKIGSVGLGGNGQFTRLAALMELGDDPWSDCLTEDLDLGVRLAINGWENRFCGETFVDQQGLTNLRALLRQRTRWAQGHFQCWKLIPALVRSQMPTVSVIDMIYYLIAPVMVLAYALILPVAYAGLAYMVLTDPATWISMYGLVFFAAMYILSFAPALYLALLYSRQAADLPLWRALWIGHVLSIYNAVWYVAEWRAVGRILTRKGGWAKTARLVEAETPPALA